MKQPTLPPSLVQIQTSKGKTALISGEIAEQHEEVRAAVSRTYAVYELCDGSGVAVLHPVGVSDRVVAMTLRRIAANLDQGLPSPEISVCPAHEAN